MQSQRSIHSTGALLALAAASAIAVAGCGSSSSGNGVASKNPTQILAAAQAASTKATSVHVKGKVSNESQTVALDLEIVSGKGAQGTITEGGVSFKLIDVGGYVYIYGSPSFYSHFGGAEAAKLFKGKWLQAPSSDSEFASLANLTNLRTLLGTELTAHATNLKKGATTSVEGTSAIALEDAAKGGTLYVATSGEPYPLKVQKTGSEGGSISFSNWNAKVALKAPANAINITKLQQQG